MKQQPKQKKAVKKRKFGSNIGIDEDKKKGSTHAYVDIAKEVGK